MIYIIYNILNILVFPIYLIILLFRFFKDKDNLNSILCRLGFYRVQRNGNKLIWMHAASVGESMIAINLVQNLNLLYPNIHFLITTGTLTSGDTINKASLNNCIHQFLPVDNYITVTRFLNYWRPDLGIFIESELWPCLISEAAKRCKLILVNARLSDKSFARWKIFNKYFAMITNHFSAVLVQSKKDLSKYQQLGCAKAKNFGNLKFGNKKLQVNEDYLEKIKQVMDDKMVFVAASTHHEDEEVILKIIHDVKNENLNYYPIIILRHPDRHGDISSACLKLNLKFSLKSISNLPKIEDDLFIVDTFGELGTFYSLSQIAFVGGSFKIGGHNLLEPAYFENAIILGPDMSNFQNITEEMLEAEAAIQINDKEEFGARLKSLLDPNNKHINFKMAQNAKNFVSEREDMLHNYLKEIANFIEK